MVNSAGQTIESRRTLRTIDTDADIDEGLAALAASDSRLVPIIKQSRPVPLRRSEGGIRGLSQIIVSQQISKAAAASIWARTIDHLSAISPDTLLAASDDDFRACGLSRPKVRTLRAIAQACDTDFDLDGLAAMPADQAVRKMTELHGVGRWTAEVYLLFCLGHADIFPAGDLALVVAVGDAFGHDRRPDEKTVRTIAEQWSPWRGVAARLFWRYYALTRKDATPA
jgi:DNA-3-methyladenine glycosylase II